MRWGRSDSCDNVEFWVPTLSVQTTEKAEQTFYTRWGSICQKVRRGDINIEMSAAYKVMQAEKETKGNKSRERRQTMSTVHNR